MPKSLIVSGVDITHTRLVELTKLADQAKPFYDWIETRFQKKLGTDASLDVILSMVGRVDLRSAILDCYSAEGEINLPLLFDGIGRNYSHRRACYYIFAWLIRDAPQQRLGPLVQRIVSSSKKSRIEAEANALSALILKYRSNVKTFSWEAVREVVIDRLEGSRRSIRGHEKEAVVRTALLTAIQAFFKNSGHYGKYARVEFDDKQVMIGNESFDVSVNLIDAEKNIQRILVPIKTRETEGGGHAHLFTRDIKSAMNAAKLDSADDYMIAVIVAKNWSPREKQTIRALVDHAVIIDSSPNEFTEFSTDEQNKLNSFVASLLLGQIAPKRLDK